MRLNNDGMKKCRGRGTTQEGNNPSNQGAIHQREVTFEALCKMFPCFCLPLFTTGLIKRKDDKYVYKKRTHSIIHHLAGAQYNYYERNLFSYPLTMNGHLRRKYGSAHCPHRHVFQNCPQHAIQASTQVASSSISPAVPVSTTSSASPHKTRWLSPKVLLCSNH